MSASHLTSQIPFPPDRKASSSTQQNHPPSRIFIGSLSSQLPLPSSSSSRSHSRHPSSETDEPRQRKRDVIRRRRKKSNSVGEWGENKAGPGGVRAWVGRKVGGGGGESEERLVQASAAAYDPEDEEEDVGLGWFRIRWDGESKSSGGRSREQSAESSGAKGGAAELNRKRAASLGDAPGGGHTTKKFFNELPQGLTSSPLATPTLPEPPASSSSLNGINLDAPGPSAPRRDRSSSQPPPSSSPTFPPTDPHSPLRPPAVTQASNVSSVVDSFVTAQSFVSASSSLPPTAPLAPHTSSTSSLPDHSSSRTITPPQLDGLPTFHHPPASPTPSSLRHPAATLPLPPPVSSQTVPPALLRSALRRPTVEPKSQTVHFPITPVLSRIGSFGKGKGRQGVLVEEIEEPEDTLEGDGEPADPSVVLGRSEAPSPGEAGQEEEDSRDFGPKDVILRDRMLVKVQYSRSAGLPSQYDEWAQRRVPADRSEAWEEKLVVLRKGAVEIWEDWNLPLRERFAGKKKLAHLIPLDVKTSLSLYSHTDLTFCLATPSTSVSSTSSSTSKKNTTRLKTNRAGTSIFLFNPKTRTRSTDWMWEIYLLLSTSYSLPRFLDVHVPDLNNARIRIPVPVVGETQGFDSTEAVVRAVSRRGVIESCVEVLKDLDGWKRLMQEMGVKEGEEGNWEEVEGKVGLAWRKRDRLDWVWTDLDVNGRRRDWNLLVGAGPLNQMRIASVLELRLARHNNAVVHLKGGGRAFEPPGIEGYLTRIKPKTQALRTTIYVTSHDGNLFVCTSNKSHPPLPPGSATSPSAAATASTSTSPAKSSIKSSKSKSSKILTSSKLPPPPPSSLEEFKFSERCRAVLQILGSSGLVDFRSIVDVRRVSRTPRPSAPAGGHDAPENGGEGNGDGGSPGDDDEGWESLEEDEEDEGGEEGLRLGKERGEAAGLTELRRKRMFEIEMITGDVQTFEAHSRLGAREWVERLNDLRVFWSAKHESIALQEMDVSQAKHIHTSDIVSGRKHQHNDDDDDASDDSDEVLDPDEPPPYLEDLWNWCVIDDCRNITKAGRVFTKRGNRQYRSKYTILLSGHLLQFSLHMDKPFHLRSHRISLIDAYVYTGLLAQDELPPSSNENALRHESRRYADGLQTSDGAEDTCLVLWYRPHLVTSNAAKLHERVASDETFTPPPLGRSGHEQMVLRARSKLERDSWAWCLGFEIERLTRRRVVREERLRAAGKID